MITIVIKPLDIPLALDDDRLQMKAIGITKPPRVYVQLRQPGRPSVNRTLYGVEIEAAVKRLDQALKLKQVKPRRAKADAA